MALFYCWLIDPTDAELIAALTEAERNAIIATRNRENWLDHVRQITGLPDGQVRLIGSGESEAMPCLTVAWWTDYVRRRHVRVVSRAVDARCLRAVPRRHLPRRQPAGVVVRLPRPPVPPHPRRPLRVAGGLRLWGSRHSRGGRLDRRLLRPLL